MTTQSEHQQSEVQQSEPQQYGEPQAYGEPHHYGEPQPDGATPPPPPPARGPEDGLSTEQLAGATDGSAPSTREFAEARAPEPAAAEEQTAEHPPLLGADERESITGRWNQIQSAFVDEPRQAVQQADELVAELMQQLARMFADERGRLESRWAQGTDVSTEDLRQGLQRYREFFQRLLAA